MQIRAIYKHIRHIHTYTSIYMHIRGYMCQYLHIRAYTSIFILKHTAKSLSGGVLGGNLPTFSGSSVKSCPLDLLLWAMRLDRQAWIWHGGRPCRAEGVQKGPGTRSRGGSLGRGGARKIGCAKVSPTTEKNACPDALGCPEWGPLAAVHRECVLGNWHQLPCFRGP